MITALGGGVGASKFLEGLLAIIGQEHLNVVVNTADDITFSGLRISPDVDTIIYRLCGIVDKQKGWGLKGDTFHCLKALGGFGLDTWFNLGDRDLATHILRTSLKQKGFTSSEITSKIAADLGLPNNVSILPMTDADVETWVVTCEGEIHFQEYLVKRKMDIEVNRVTIRGIDQAEPAPGVLEAIKESRVIIICPSNPIISVGPILQVHGIRKALEFSEAKIIGISPLIGGVPLRGPADRLMKGLGLRVSSTQIARLYQDFLDVMVIDTKDSSEAQEINEIGIESFVVNTLMADREKARALATALLSIL